MLEHRLPGRLLRVQVWFVGARHHACGRGGTEPPMWMFFRHAGDGFINKLRTDVTRIGVQHISQRHDMPQILRVYQPVSH